MYIYISVYNICLEREREDCAIQMTNLFTLQLIQKHGLEQPIGYTKKWTIIIKDSCPCHWLVYFQKLPRVTLALASNCTSLGPNWAWSWNTPPKEKQWFTRSWCWILLLISPLGCVCTVCSTLVNCRQWHSWPKKGKLFETTRYNGGIWTIKRWDFINKSWICTRLIA
jgi:hypothetical protein